MKSQLVLLTSVTLALSACNGDNDDVESVAPAPIPASDADYIDNLVPHHQLAIEMADVEIADGTRQDVREMAQRMKVKQQEEIAKMESIRAGVAGSAQVPAMHDPHGEEDLARLQAAMGTEVDILFLENMIPHHADGVSLSHRALDNLSNAELRSMAEMTVVMQTREMNEMLDMLGR